jgi:hypothetical protein
VVLCTTIGISVVIAATTTIVEVATNDYLGNPHVKAK